MMSGAHPAVCRWRGSRAFQLGGPRADEEQEGAEQRHVFEKHDPAVRRSINIQGEPVRIERSNWDCCCILKWVLR